MRSLGYLSIFAAGCSLYYPDEPDHVRPPVVPQPDGGTHPDGHPPTPDATHACGDGVHTPGEVCFGSPIVFAIGGPVYSARLVDANADGHLDLVYLTRDRIVIRNGSANGFDAPHDGPLTTSWWLAHGDLDGDGMVDLATAGREAMTAWRGTAGQFSFAAEAATGPATGLAIGNVDGYPADELIYTGADRYQVRWLDADNQLRLLHTTAMTNINALGSADIDDDGHLDGLVTAATYGTVMAGGVGGVDHTHGYGASGAGSQVTAMTGGDIDGDGETDLVFTQVDPGMVTFISDGQYHSSPEVGGSPRFVATAELDGIDGAETVVGMPATRELCVVSRQPAWKVRPAIPLDQAMTSMYFDGDVNGDGVADLVITLEDKIIVLPSAR